MQLSDLMKKLSFLFIVLITFLLFSIKQTHAQNAPEAVKPEFIKGKVITVEKEGKREVGGTENIFQNVRIRIEEGADKGKEVKVEYGGVFILTNEQKVAQGDTVVLSKITDAKTGKAVYAISDKYRLPILLWLIVGFFVFVIAIAGKKGVGSIIGMIISVAVIFLFIVPQILQGHNPLLISILGSITILVTTIYLAHGFSQQTTVALAATFISLLFTGILAVLAVNISHLSGMGSEDIYALQQGFKDTINFRGLLLGGIIIGAIGVLDDVTTTQTATIFSLAHANERLSVKDLFTRGMKIGREHITSLVNTLVLAYAGASIAIFIFLHIGLQTQAQPLWVMLNSEVLAEEIIRTLAGSIGLIMAVPITTFLAAFFARYSLKIN
jgi:uncharacterized membrane protein